MHRQNILTLFIILFIILLLPLNGQNNIVEKHGQLRVEGNYIVNQYDKPVVLRGMSFFWSQWMGKYYNADCVKWLKDEWKCTVVRTAMGIEHGGYLVSPFSEYDKVSSVIDACIEEGIYVIVDWHDHNAQQHEKEAIAFFSQIAEQYGDHPNIIYEIYNEPLQISWEDSVKPYSERVISEIRKIDSNNIILAGSPTWSQDVDIASANPLEFDNIAYTLHFYAATHKQYLRNKAQLALNRGVALFVSEFGTCESTGNGFLDYEETNTWLNFLEENKISWVNWSIADKDETSAVLLPGANTYGNWPDTQISESGIFIKSKIIEYNNPTSVTELDSEFNDELINQIQNFPNPFNNTTILKIVLDRPEKIKLDIYNNLGQYIQNIYNKGMHKGEHLIKLKFSNLPSGTYFLSCQFGTKNEILKIQLLQ